MKKTLTLLFFCLSISIGAQSNFVNFLKSSGPIKSWVILHPFKAKLSLKISHEASRVADSLKTSHLLDGDASGGQVDAFRHSYWMARLRQEIGEDAARSLGVAHEEDNYITYLELKLEDGILPDKASSEMDLYNNEQGLRLTVKGSSVSKEGLIYRVINAIHEGKMKVIKKDKTGAFLTKEGRIVLESELKGRWENNKCLVSSNHRVIDYLKQF